MTLRIIGFPSLYVQGPAALRELPRCVEAISARGRPAAIVDPFVVPLFEEIAAATEMEVVTFSGECTQREISRLTDLLSGQSVGVILGAGGGKALDTAKMVAHALGVPIIIVPTVASSDAPTSRIAALYDDNHKIISVPKLRRNPDAVIVDTDIIRRAPPRFFAAGIGDAITKKYEVSESARAGNLNFFDASQTRLSLLLAEECGETLYREARSALAAVREGRDDPSIERVVEATVLYSGLAFEGGGLSIAHGLLRGLTERPETQSVLHGELVAYGTLVQLVLAAAPDAEIEKLRRFLVDLDLPVTLAQIGLGGLDRPAIDRIAEATFDAAYVASQITTRGISAESLAEAIVATEAL